jgi:uncharacterized membrane protein
MKETMRKIGRSLKLNDDKGYKIAIVLMLIVVSSLLIGYYLISRLPPEGYSTIYILDYQQKKAINYPELLVINENNTFNVWVGVENHMGKRQSFEVLEKVIKGTTLSYPVDAKITSSYEKTMENGEIWETPAEVSIKEPGSYSVIFELWIYDDNAGAFQFSYNCCILPLEVIDQT